MSDTLSLSRTTADAPTPAHPAGYDGRSYVTIGVTYSKPAMMGANVAGTEVEPAKSTGVVTKVDPAEVPSAAWGWSGESRRAFRVAGWVVVVILLAMLFEGPQGSSAGTGNIGYLFLIGFAIALAAILIRDSWLQGKPR